MSNGIKVEILKGIQNKRDILPREYSMDSEHFLEIITELVGDGYIKGVIFPKDKQGKPVLANMTRAHITEKGESFLRTQM